jgi:hypothetical protein
MGCISKNIARGSKTASLCRKWPLKFPKFGRFEQTNVPFRIFLRDQCMVKIIEWSCTLIIFHYVRAQWNNVTCLHISILRGRKLPPLLYVIFSMLSVNYPLFNCVSKTLLKGIFLGGL